jgi:hypothetical protein
MKYFFLLLATLSMFNVLSQKAYFQQEVNTKIDVTLDDKRHFLHGSEEIEYINNSKDNLSYLILHIWPNAYKDNSSALATQLDENGEVDFHFASANDRGYIDSLNFEIEGKKVTYTSFDDQPDIIKINLPEPLQPGKSIVIKTPFRVKIPKGIYSRLGHIGESYQITQWFPKPAVYDTAGWHPIPYLSQGEFFSEYGSYDVKITLPKNYVVGATGDLIDGDKEIAFLDSIVAKTEEMATNNTFPINKAGWPNMSFPLSSPVTKTLHYHQENVHDFAWFADKRYNVLKGEVELPGSKRKVTTWAMFTNNEADLWNKSIEYLNDATYYYSLWTGDYPYNHVTAVDGSISAGGGMEYPNVTVIGESYTAQGLEQVIVHEVGHNWFYGILGSNERENAWMDEGLNTFTENRYTETKYPDAKMDFGLPSGIMKKVGLDQFGPRGMYDLGYMFNARRNYDQAIQTRSDLFTPTNYGAIVYGKTGIGFDYLLAYLGDELFDKCMHAYFEEWKFKHPHPEDVRRVFERESGKDLSWLFDDYIKTTLKMDYGISKVKSKGDSLEVTIKNNASINAPVSITSLSQGVPSDVVWLEGFETKKTITIPNNNTDKLLLDATQDMPTVNRKDDQSKTSGLCKKTEPIKFKFLGSFENPKESQVYYAPALGWNAQDKFMIGAAFYNTAIPERKLEWLVAPMYAFGSENLVGIGDLKYNLYGTESIIRKLTFGYNFKAFSTEVIEDTYFYNDVTYTEATQITEHQQWQRHEVSADIELNNYNLRKAKHNILIRGLNISEAISLFNTDVTNAINIRYTIKNKQILKPASIKFDVISLKSLNYGTFTGVSMEAKLRKNYNVDLKGFELRFFVAQTIDRNEGLFTSKYNWSLSGQNGSSDYLYDYTLLGRDQSYPDMTSQQTTGTQGDFKVSSVYAIGSSNSWLASLNFKVEAPIGIPIGVFADAGMHPVKVNANGQVTDEVRVQYDGGIYIPIRKDIFEIYIPLLYSADIKSALDYSNVSFMQRIRFVLNFNELNPFKIVKNIKP